MTAALTYIQKLKHFQAIEVTSVSLEREIAEQALRTKFGVQVDHTGTEKELKGMENAVIETAKAEREVHLHFLLSIQY